MYKPGEESTHLQFVLYVIKGTDTIQLEDVNFSLVSLEEFIEQMERELLCLC